ncbi:UvrD-helicase domain-containing protein [Nocardiopsis sp. EMB25]|uniref:UvrD-helicase domain-containing protein n=1 Tax=Nocardiopsis sp. EMB25 TaxID=2835867 RepID=UPI002283586E|nr:UvrD-helicase domain-containing protein [Nocardiopsis sp. EMB25]MCY9784199.1 UvrD-helicase domain-containing protein [Nocardiopsis sp. EMB25]
MLAEARNDDHVHELCEHARAAQRAVTEADIGPGQLLSVRACPGAGKTRVIVDRHLERALPARQGRAITSFTKAAGGELRRRCHEAARPDLTTFPHFIGTLDTFIWLHLVRPHLRPPEKGGRSWRRLESWERHPEAHNGDLSLEDFSFVDVDGLRVGKASLNESARDRLQGRDPDHLEWWAAKKLKALFAQGYVTGDLIRGMALRHLAHERLASVVRTVLTRRFGELVIDEAQDCSAEERGIVRSLVDLGLPVMVVGDPAQAIYGFRDTVAAEQEPVVLNGARTLGLRHNWRSSQVICDLAATLRVAEPEPDTAVGEHAGDKEPIRLIPLPTHGVDHVRAFCGEADRLRISVPERYVVAPWRSCLPRDLAGAPRPPGSPIGQVAWAVGVLRAEAAPTRQRDRAAEIIRANILDVWYGPDGIPLADRLERHAVTAQGIERARALVLRDLPDLDRTTGEWRARAQEVFGRHAPDPGRSLPEATPRWVRRHAPTDARPAYEVGGHSGPLATPRVEVGTVTNIHQVKGEEADAVLVIVPRPTVRTRKRVEELLSSWVDGAPPRIRESAEDLNVLYVGATRARRLLAFALCDEHLPWVEAFLDEREIAFRTLD